MSNWQRTELGWIHVNTDAPPPGTKGSLRRAKRELRRVRRFLNMRVKWTPQFAQHLQGRAMLVRTLKRARTYRGK